MSKLPSVARCDLAAHCHEITVSLSGNMVGEFDQLLVVGMAVNLAIHLRGVPAVSYDLLRQIGLHLLHIPPTTMPRVVELLGEAEFVLIDKQGSSIRSVVPTVPFFEDLFDTMGEVAEDRTLSEHERMAIELVSRLRAAPLVTQTLYNQVGSGERKLFDSALDLGDKVGYLMKRRARGREIVLSPLYFPDNPDAFADLVAGSGSGRVGRVLSLLQENQGWPLAMVEQTWRIGGEDLTSEEVVVATALAQEGFTPPPSITTAHAGNNYFLFGPRPGGPKLPTTKRPIYEAAMALVAAVRQGLLLPRKHAVRNPTQLLRALREKKSLRANTEAMEQYREVVATFGLGRLVPDGGSFHRFELIENPDNLEALDMAIRLVEGGAAPPSLDGEICLAFHKGQDYLDSLVSRQRLVAERTVPLTEETRWELDNLLLRRAIS